MKYYQRFAESPVFSKSDAQQIIGSVTATSSCLSRMLDEGHLHRIKKNLYTCVNLITGDDLANRFQIASRITDDSFVSYHSAFEFYGHYNQVFFNVQVSSAKRFKEFDYGDYHYECFPAGSDLQVEVIQGVRVTTLERTIVDSVNLLGRVMDAEELVKCLDLVHYVSESRILLMLSAYDKEILYRKVGYILSFYKEEYNLSDIFFDECKRKGITSNKGSLIPSERMNLEFIPEWGIYGYKDLRKLAEKGEDADV